MDLNKLSVFIDNSAKNQLQVSLAQENKIIDLLTISEEGSLSESLSLALYGLLKKHNLSPANVSEVWFTNGPGSFTGQRIILSFVKGWAYVHRQIQFFAVNTLSLMAYYASQVQSAEYYLPMIDARRDEVFTAVYGNDESEIISPQALVLNESSFSELPIGSKLCLCGNGAEKVIPYLSTRFEVLIANINPDAQGFLNFSLGSRMVPCNGVLPELEPFYLKEGNASASK